MQSDWWEGHIYYDAPLDKDVYSYIGLSLLFRAGLWLWFWIKGARSTPFVSAHNAGYKLGWDECVIQHTWILSIRNDPTYKGELNDGKFEVTINYSPEPEDIGKLTNQIKDQISKDLGP